MRAVALLMMTAVVVAACSGSAKPSAQQESPSAPTTSTTVVHRAVKVRHHTRKKPVPATTIPTTVAPTLPPTTAPHPQVAAATAAPVTTAAGPAWANLPPPPPPVHIQLKFSPPSVSNVHSLGCQLTGPYTARAQVGFDLIGGSNWTVWDGKNATWITTGSGPSYKETESLTAAGGPAPTGIGFDRVFVASTLDGATTQRTLTFKLVEVPCPS